MQYTEKVMEAFQNPKNVGEIENYDGMGMIGSEACGDIMQVFIKVENGVIADAKFKTFGCAAAIATSSTAQGGERRHCRREVQNLRLRGGDRHLLDRHGDDQGHDGRRSAGSHQQKGHRGAGRASAAEDPLFGTRRAGNQGGDRGL